MKLSVIIPCYNEAMNLPLLLEQFFQAINRNDIEIIIVNNGSQDDSQDIIDRLLPNYPFAKCLKINHNQGYGFGIISGLKSAVGDYLAWTHADLQTSPVDVIKGFELMERSNNPKKTLVKGRRYGRSFGDNLFTWGMGIFETIYLGVPLSDINAQPNIFHRSFFAAWKDPPQDFSLDLYAFYMAHKQALSVIRFPVHIKSRIYGRSKWNFGLKARWKFIKRTLEYSAQLKQRLV